MTAADIAAPYLSHLPVLAAAMTATSGPVLELGAGLGSTLLLHGLCGATRRSLLTLENDAAWMRRFQSYGRTWHRFRLVPDYLDRPEYADLWGLAFVDHGMYEQRGHAILQLRHVPVVVVHDTCFPWLYDYVATLATYRYRWDWQIGGPQTTVISNRIDIRSLFAGMGL